MGIAAASPLMRIEAAGGVCIVQEVCHLMPDSKSYMFLRSFGPKSANLELLGPNDKVRQALVGSVVPYHVSAD